MSVCLYQINVKTAEPIGPKFCVEPCITPRKVNDAQNYKKLYPKAFDFCEI